MARQRKKDEKKSDAGKEQRKGDNGRVMPKGAGRSSKSGKGRKLEGSRFTSFLFDNYGYRLWIIVIGK